MDFYWHYSGKETIDEAGKNNFIRAIRVGKQVFRSLTEYIQVFTVVGDSILSPGPRIFGPWIAGFLDPLEPRSGIPGSLDPWVRGSLIP